MKADVLYNRYAPRERSDTGNIDIKGIAVHSSNVEKGYLFFALPGEFSHGMEFAKEAAENGASLIVFDSLPERYELDIPAVQVTDARKALSAWSAEFYGNPAAGMQIVGVTGTNGKTTVSHLIYNLLNSSGRPAGIVGTSGYRFASRTGKFSMTTPMPHELNTIFAEMADREILSAVMEVSSHALELKRVEDIDFHSAVFTNLTQDHLDFHGTLENYYQSKLRLFRMIREKGRKRAVVNIDDEYGARISRDAGMEVTGYGFSAGAEYRAEVIKTGLEGSEFRLHAGDIVRDINIKLIGEYNVLNCLAAIAWAVEGGGMKMEQVCHTVSEAKPVPGRMEMVSSHQNGKFIVVDYAHTPDALENVLKALRKITEGKLICVFGCGGNRDRIKRPLMGQIAGIYSDSVYLTSDNPRNEDPHSILLDIELGIRETTTPYTVVADREEAIKEALEYAAPGDCVLIAGKGDEEYQIVGDNRIPFSDRNIAAKYMP